MDPMVLLPSPAADFNFGSTSTSPYDTAPSSPNISFPNFYYSELANPTRSRSSFQNLSPINPDATDGFHSTDLFASCEEYKGGEDEDEADFAFDFSGQLELPSISDADELFHGGKIKPLEPPVPRLQSSNDPPRSMALSPMTYNKKRSESFTDAFHHTPGDHIQNPSLRGRESKTTTSLSPLRVSNILSDDQTVTTTQSSPFGFTWYNKWNLKNLLLFRSTSEGSATTSNEPLKNYSMITTGDQDVKNSSFRSSDGGGSVDGSSRRRMKRKMSAHEIHYTLNRAVAEEMKRKTLLPYKSGLLDCFGFSHKLNESSRGR